MVEVELLLYPAPDAEEVTAALEADVILPYASTVITGITVALPYVAAATPEFNKPTVTAPDDVVAEIGAVLDTDTIFASVYVVEILEPFHVPEVTVPSLEALVITTFAAATLVPTVIEVSTVALPYILVPESSFAIV